MFGQSREALGAFLRTVIGLANAGSGQKSNQTLVMAVSLHG
jgi:hypothetical protein